MTKNEYNELLKEINDTRAKLQTVIRRIQEETDPTALTMLLKELSELGDRKVELRRRADNYLLEELDKFSNALKGIF